MNENGQQPVEPTLRQLVDRYREQRRQGDERVGAMFSEALQREREQGKWQRLLVEQVHREAIAQGRTQPLPPYGPPTIPYTELPAAEPNSQLCQEWNHYRREVGRLLAQGAEGRFVLIKGDKIIGMWDTQEEAEAVAFHIYALEARLIHQVQRCERLLRGSSRTWRCPG